MKLFEKRNKVAGKGRGLSDAFSKFNYINDLKNRTDEEIASMAKLNILLIGKTGVGKSTLINAVFRENLAQTGIGAPVTDHLEKIQKEGVPINLYDTKGLELSTQSQKEVQDEIIGLLNEARGEDRIHCIWYCINSQSNRLEEIEKIWINGLSPKFPVIVVLTQSLMAQNSEELKNYIKEACPHIKNCIPVVAKEIQLEGFTIPQRGLMELLAATEAQVPEEVKASFTNAQRLDLDRKVKMARRWVNGFIAETFFVGFVPIPFADSPIISASQITMIAKIISIFGVSYDQSKLASLVAGVAGLGGAVTTGRAVTTGILKMIPGAGTLLGGLISGSTAGGITKILGEVYIAIMKEVAQREYRGEKILPEEMEAIARKEFQRFSSEFAKFTEKEKQ